MALAGRFSDHHALMCKLHLRHVDELTELIDTVDQQIEATLVPFRAERELLMTIPGIGPAASAVILSEIGADMSFFPDADHPASWAGLAPANNESGGRRRAAGTRHGCPHLANVLVECAWAASRIRTRAGALFHRLVRRFGTATPARRRRPPSPSPAASS
jgi:transposase